VQRRGFTGLIGAPGKVVLGYPVGFNVTLPFHASVLRLQQYEWEKPERDRLLAKVTHASGLYVADNRTLLAQKFLETDCEWLWQVDTDIEFQPWVLERMVELAGSDKKVLAASVPLGDATNGGYPSCGFVQHAKDGAPLPPGVWQPVWPPFGEQPFEVDGIATACCLIHREVFEAIAARHGQCWFHHLYLPASQEGTPPQDFRFHSQGEDLAFSVRAQEAGFGAWLAHVPGLRHYKTTPWTHDEAMIGRSNLGRAVGEE
jgi:GT2 family glycosyltransferase